MNLPFGIAREIDCYSGRGSLNQTPSTLGGLLDRREGAGVSAAPDASGKPARRAFAGHGRAGNSLSGTPIND